MQNIDRKPFPEKPKRGQESLVKQNYEFFQDRINEQIENKPTDEVREKLLDTYYSLLDLILIYIEVDSSDDAYDIFETMNARGAELTVADLVKNHVFKQVRVSSSGNDFAKDAWGEIIDNLEGTGIDFTTFLRYHWLSKYDFVMKKALFKAIKSRVDDHPLFLKDLKEDSRIIKGIADARVNDLALFDDFRKTKSVNDSLRTINAIGAKACYVLILSIFRNKHILRNAHKEIRFLRDFNFITMEFITRQQIGKILV